jgi:dehydrogenase/reductase SDR family protein 4
MIQPYAISKTALLGMTKALAPELADMGIRINCVAPGLFKTKFGGVLWNQGEERANYLANVALLKRFGDSRKYIYIYIMVVKGIVMLYLDII